MREFLLTRKVFWGVFFSGSLGLKASHSVLLVYCSPGLIHMKGRKANGRILCFMGFVLRLGLHDSRY